MARVIIASSAGTAFEWYDFFIFGSLAPVISKVFFAGLDPTPALIAALALFAAGFAFRPLGALIFGVVGDQLGRKGAFLVTVSLMGAATFLIGLLPTYAQAGTLGPRLLIVLRILQGIALGGEYGGAAIYVAEHAPNDKRGASTGWIQSSASFGLLAALLVIVATRTGVRRGRLRRLGLAHPVPRLGRAARHLGLDARQARRKPRTSPSCGKKATIAKRRCAKPSATGQNLKRVLIAFFGIMCAQGAVWYFTFFYLQVFLEKSLGLPGQTKDLLLIVMTVVSAPLYVYFGWLSDRIGRKPVMVGGMLLALVLYFPGIALDRAGRQPGAGRGAARNADGRRDRSGDLLGPVRSGRHREVRQRLRHRQERARHQGHFLSRRGRRRTARPGSSSAPKLCRSPAAKACRGPTSRRSRPRRPMRSAPTLAGGGLSQVGRSSADRT